MGSNRAWNSVLIGVSLLAGIAGCAFWVGFGYERWNSEVRNAAHPAGWVSRTGTITAAGGTDYSHGAPYRSEPVRYFDYHGVRHTVLIDLPIDLPAPGSHVPMYVRNDEAVYVPDSVDWSNQVSNNDAVPGEKANHGPGWPAMGFFLGIIQGLIASFLVFVMLDELGEFVSRKFAGRLGTR